MILSNFRIIFFQFRSFRKIPMLVRILIFNGTESYWNMKKISYSSQKNVKNKVTAIVVLKDIYQHPHRLSMVTTFVMSLVISMSSK